MPLKVNENEVAFLITSIFQMSLKVGYGKSESRSLDQILRKKKVYTLETNLPVQYSLTLYHTSLVLTCL